MPSLRLTFPEKDAPSTITLRGPCVTVGRLANNAIQIRDRTVSAQHAELIFEDDHYRVHDLGATNGILVNGELVTDYHLREACEISFGGVTCQFSLENPAEAEPTTEALATHAEAAALRSENTSLKQQHAAVQEELENLRRVHAASEGATVPQEEHDRIIEECATLKRALEEENRAFAQLREEQAVLRRDRDNLQRALDEAATKETPVAAAKAAEPVVQVLGEPPSVPVEALDDAPTAVAPVPLPAPVAPPSALPKPTFVPPANLPLPTGIPAPGIAPAATPKPAFMPVGNRPTPAAVPTPSVPLGANGAPRLAQPTARPLPNLNRPPAPNAVPRPLPGAKPVTPTGTAAHPNLPGVRVVKPIALPPKPSAEAIGPKGTQKVSV